jgi:hypothetical protein
MGSWSATATPATVLREAFIMYVRPLHRLRAIDRAAARVLHRRLLAATRPITAALSAGPLADLVRSKPELIADNALLRQHLIIFRRWVKGRIAARPRVRPSSAACPAAWSAASGTRPSAGVPVDVSE